VKQFTYRAALWGCQFRFLRRLRLQLRAKFKRGKRDGCLRPLASHYRFDKPRSNSYFTTIDAK
jgi:hypothetical protein